MSTDRPIVVSGIGGSGTRVLAEILMAHGVYLGDELNPALDNLWFQFWMKNEVPFSNQSKNIEFFVKRMIMNEDWDEKEISLVEDYFLKAVSISPRLSAASNFVRAYESLKCKKLAQKQDENRLWGWKNPRSILFADQIFQMFPKVKFIYLRRHPLDMAFSKNLNQLKNFGRFWGLTQKDLTPRNQLKYWLAVDGYVSKLVKERQIFVLNYEDLVFKSHGELAKLSLYLGIDINNEILDKLICKPESVGRYKKYDCNMFDTADLLEIEKLGF